MAEGKKAGTIIVELSLDATKYTSAQKEILAAAEKNSADIEQTFGRVGITSDKMYDAMRKNVQNSLAAIKQSHLTTAEEKVRAEQAAASKIQRINEEQFGRQAGLLDKMKNNYFVAAAAITAAWFAANRAFDLAERAAAYAESLDNLSMLTAKYNVSGRQMVDTIVENSTGLIRLGTAADVATEAMSKGFTPDMLAKIAGWAPIIDDLSTSVGSSDEAFRMLIQTIAAGRERGITQLLGATLDLKTAFGDQAAQMSKAEKAMAMYEMVAVRVEQIQRTGVGTTDSYADKIERFRNQVDALKLTLGDVILRVGAGLMATFQSVSALALGLARVVMAPIQALMLATDYLGITKGKAEEYKRDMEALADAGEDLAMKAGSNFDLMRKGLRAGAASGAGVDLGFGGADKAGKDDKEAERARKAREREVAKMWADEGKIVHDALMEEAGMTQEYHDTIRKMDDEAFKAEEAGKAAQAKFEADRLKEREDALRESFMAETGMTQEYLDTVRGLKDAEFKAWMEMHDPAAMADFYDSIVGYEQEAHDRKVALIEAERDARIAAGVDAAAAAKKAAQDIGELDQKMFEKKARQVFDATGDMASAFAAIGSMYDKNSDEYAKMQEAAKAMIVLQQAVAVANAVAAIANQGLGDPYTAFARIAAMAAAMGSLLANIGGSISGGGASAAPALPASTVLGAEPGTGSESIGKVWELLQDTYDLEYRELTGIHSSMKDLNQNITALVTSIVRTGTVGTGAGITGIGTTFGEAGGMFATEGKTLWDKWMNVVGGVANSVFGGNVSKSLEGAGIEFKGITAGELIAGKYMDALEYSVVKTVKDGGWFHSDSTSYQTIYKALDSDVSRLFTLVFENMSAMLVELAKGLGVDVNQAMAYVFKGERLDLTGKTADEINKAVSEYISRVGDVAVEALFGSIVLQYQKLNEGLFETAARLVMDKAVVADILEMTNQQFSAPNTMFTDRRGNVRIAMQDATEKMIAFTESIIELAGGLDKLTEAAATYYDKFFTDEEKQARLQGQLAAALGDMGMALPDVRQGYRDLVEGLDLNTTAGQEAYVILLSLSEAADQYYSALEDVGGAQSDLTKALRDQSKMIRDWIADLSLSALAPVQSMEGWRLEYERQKAMASAPGATTQDVSAYLNYAKEYLQFMRTYGGDYKAVYDAIVGDVQALGDIKDAQISAIEAADAAARYNADRIVEAIFGREVGPYQLFAAGGLTRGPSIAGERGQEWIVPTYEPQRSRFLENVPPQFWENLRGGGVSQGGGDITVKAYFVLNDKVVGEAVTRQITRNSDLSGAIAGVRRMN